MHPQQITAPEIERRLGEIYTLEVADPAGAQAAAVRLLVDTLRSIAAWGGDTESRTVARAALRAAEVAAGEIPAAASGTVPPA